MYVLNLSQAKTWCAWWTWWKRKEQTWFSFLIRRCHKRSRKIKRTNTHTQKQMKTILLWVNIFYTEEPYLLRGRKERKRNWRHFVLLPHWYAWTVQMWKTWIAWMRMNGSRRTVIALSTKAKFWRNAPSLLHSQFRLSKRVNAKMEHYYRITTPHVRSCIIFMM